MKEKIICYCKNVSEQTIIDAIRAGAGSLKEIQDITGACTGDRCEELNPKKKCCSEDIISLINSEGINSNSNHFCCNSKRKNKY